MYQAIGFDLGETLIHYQGVPLNWQSLYQEALASVAQSCTYQAGKETLAQAATILSRYNTRLHPRIYEVSADRILGEILQAWGVSNTRYLTKAKQAFFSFFQMRLLPYDDMLPILQLLKTKGIKVGVLTDVPYGMERMYAEQDIQPFAEYIDAFITSAEIGYRKPAAQGYLALAKHLAVQPELMAFVGNEEKDMIGANHAGMFSILLDREQKNLSYGEQWRISSLTEIQALLAS
jgi:putative hydrolase of the HAD superfamily